MDPISALGLASNIIQIVDFSARLLSRGQDLYSSADGKLEENVVLENAARNLAELAKDLVGFTPPHRSLQSTADKQLLELRKQTETDVRKLRVALKGLTVQGNNRKWKSVVQALKSVWKEKDIAALQERLDHTRKQIDTVLLISLREAIQRMSNPSTSGVTVKPGPVDKEAQQRHSELLDAIRARNLQPSSKTDLDLFATQLATATDVDIEARFHKLVLARLYFQQMPDRAESIPKKYSNTFDWIFRDYDESSDDAPWSSLTRWLQSVDENVYWITGKPGAGKSTLMKYLAYNPNVWKLARQWAKQTKLTKASFYFWNSGASIQMSLLGLLQTLLYKCLRNDRELALALLRERFDQFVAFGGGLDDFTWPELHRAFTYMISDESRSFLFLIDGLDEFDGKPMDVINLVVDAARSNVKICTASRPWLPFEDAFKQRPSLLLERLTRKDILSYVTEHFNGNEHYVRLRDSDRRAALSLLSQIVDMASGVFLWVYLVVQSLLEGLSNADLMVDLQRRLDALPSDLEALYDNILNRMDREYFKQACQIFRLVQAFREAHKMYERLGIITYRQLPGEHLSDDPMLLELSYADDTASSQSCLAAPCEPVSPEIAHIKAKHMERRLNARCKGFLELRPPQMTTRWDDLMNHHVAYLHRTGRDFIESDSHWQEVLKVTGGDKYNPDQHWANAFLLCHKKHHSRRRGALRETGMVFPGACLKQALYIQHTTGRVQYSYLNELFAYSYRNEVFASVKPKDSGCALIDFLCQRVIYREDTTGFIYMLADYFNVLFANTAHENTQNALAKLRVQCKADKYGAYAEPTPYAYMTRVVRFYSTSPNMRWMRKKPEIPVYD